MKTLLAFMLVSLPVFSSEENHHSDSSIKDEKNDLDKLYEIAQNLSKQLNESLENIHGLNLYYMYNKNDEIKKIQEQATPDKFKDLNNSIKKLDFKVTEKRIGENHCYIFSKKNITEKPKKILIYIHGGPSLSISDPTKFSDLMIKIIKSECDRGYTNSHLNGLIQNNTYPTISSLAFFKSICDKDGTVIALNYHGNPTKGEDIADENYAGKNGPYDAYYAHASNDVKEQIFEIIKDNPEAEITLMGHSAGTMLTINSLANPDITRKIKKIILSGIDSSDRTLENIVKVHEIKTEKSDNIENLKEIKQNAIAKHINEIMKKEDIKLTIFQAENDQSTKAEDSKKLRDTLNAEKIDLKEGHSPHNPPLTGNQENIKKDFKDYLGKISEIVFN